MRTTVGPLPSAVYWRRRAVVLGAALLGIIVLFVSCSGDGKDGQTGRNTGASQLPTPAPATGSPSASPTQSFLASVPGGGGPSLPAPADLESPSPGTTTGGNTGTGQNTNVTAASGSICADTELSLVATAAPATVKRGAPVDFTLTVKNISTRTCSRDVGSGPQELYVDQGARKYWSSDTCNTAKGSDVKAFAPGEQRVYQMQWNGRQSSTCAGLAASGPNPPPGQFELRARLGTLISQPFTLTIAA
jgi:hypothetical protein